MDNKSGVILLLLGFVFTFSFNTNANILQECFVEGVKSKAKCGILDVAKNPSLPVSENNKVSLNIVVLPKFKQESQQLPIFFLAGGPGQAATELARGLSWALRDLRQQHDIVLIDQRGTGKSSPLLCNEEVVDSLSFDDQQLDLKQETLKCLVELNDRHLASYNTYQSIDDFEAVRSALGYNKIHLLGGSYGTRAGFVYLKRYPGSIETAVLDSNAPMQLAIGLFGQTAERAFELLLDDCAAHQGCSTAFPDLKQDYLTLMTKLRANPIKQKIFHPVSGLEVTMVLTEQKVVEALRGTLYDLQSRQILPYMIHKAANQDYRAIAAWIGRHLDSERQPGSLYSALTMNILCNEDIPRINAEQFNTDAKNYFSGELGFSMFTKVCEHWPRWHVSEDFSEPLKTEVPVLLFSGKYDPVTPPEYGEMAVEGLTNVKHVVIKQGSHVASLSMCIEPIKEFMQSSSFTELNLDCSTQVSPFMFFTDLNQLH